MLCGGAFAFFFLEARERRKIPIKWIVRLYTSTWSSTATLLVANVMPQLHSPVRRPFLVVVVVVVYRLEGEYAPLVSMRPRCTAGR